MWWTHKDVQHIVHKWHHHLVKSSRGFLPHLSSIKQLFCSFCLYLPLTFMSICYSACSILYTTILETCPYIFLDIFYTWISLSVLPTIIILSIFLFICRFLLLVRVFLQNCPHAWCTYATALVLLWMWRLWL